MSTPTAAETLGELDYVQWSADVLSALGLTVGVNNLTAMVAWCLAEGGHNENSASWNPLGTTITAATAGLPADAVVRTINSHGVKAYRSRADGLTATVKTLQLPRYTAVVSQLRSNADPVAVSAAVAASGWGTGPGIVANITNARKAVASRGEVKAGGGIDLTPGFNLPGVGQVLGGSVAGGIAGGAVDKVKGAENVLGRLTSLADFVDLLSQPGTWVRVWMFGAGIGIVVLGGVLIISDNRQVQALASTAVKGTV